MTITFRAWPKTPRLFREIVITEKIDGTNSAVIIEEINPELDHEAEGDAFVLAQVESNGKTYAVAAQSRNRASDTEGGSTGDAYKQAHTDLEQAVRNENDTYQQFIEDPEG